MESFTLRNHQGLAINASVHTADTASPFGTVIYLHGGGCIFGQRDDLPHPYIDLFNARGYHVVALDYLLAPESPLAEIIDVLRSTLLDVVGEQRYGLGLGAGTGRWVLLGRSAGAFLAFQVAARLRQEGGPMPATILSFYGYASLDEKEFHVENRYYASFARVDRRTHDAALAPGKLVDAPFADRYALYVYYRQRGTWPAAVLGEAPVASTVIPEDALASFPPTLLVHSAYDPDVPFRCSKVLANAIPGSTLIPVFDQEEHDVDREPSRGLPFYRQALDWLDELATG